MNLKNAEEISQEKPQNLGTIKGVHTNSFRKKKNLDGTDVVSSIDY